MEWIKREIAKNSYVDSKNWVQMASVKGEVTRFAFWPEGYVKIVSRIFFKINIYLTQNVLSDMKVEKSRDARKKLQCFSLGSNYDLGNQSSEVIYIFGFPKENPFV